MKPRQTARQQVGLAGIAGAQMKIVTLAGSVAAALLTSSATAMAQPSASAHTAISTPPRDVATLATQATEEGQKVVYDGGTWRRRELAKRLPLYEPWPSEAAIGAQFKRFSLEAAPVPDEIPTPSRILQDVYLVNTRPNLTYLIDAGPGQLVLVDPGLESNVASILKNVEALGFSPANIKWVLNTHAHFDHAMADAAFQRLGAKILVGRGDVPAVEKGTEVTAKFALPPNQNARYPILRVDWPVDDGERLLLGNKVFTAIHTPGHTAGATCFQLPIAGKTVLFGGDVVLFDGRLGSTSPFSDDAAYLASLRKLGKVGAYFRWDVLLPGHGTLVLDRAYLDILKAERLVEHDLAVGAPLEAAPYPTADYRKMMFGRP